jgi:hypothetical protein
MTVNEVQGIFALRCDQLEGDLDEWDAQSWEYAHALGKLAASSYTVALLDRVQATEVKVPDCWRRQVDDAKEKIDGLSKALGAANARCEAVLRDSGRELVNLKEQVSQAVCERDRARAAQDAAVVERDLARTASLEYADKVALLNQEKAAIRGYCKLALDLRRTISELQQRLRITSAAQEAAVNERDVNRKNCLDYADKVALLNEEKAATRRDCKLALEEINGSLHDEIPEARRLLQSIVRGW